MARIYGGIKGRVIGAALGGLMIATGLVIYVFMGVVAPNVPFPGVLEGVILDLVPPLRGVSDPIEWWAAILFGLVSLVCVVVGTRNFLEALVEPDYAIRITKGGGRFR
jgi:hypothetical protein